MALFQAASEMLGGVRSVGGAKPNAAASPPPVDEDAEKAALKAQLAALQARLDGITRG